jgi:hypothetical protein
MTRQHLPKRRENRSFVLQMSDRFNYTITLGYDGVCDGQPHEVFVDCNKLTTDMDTAGRDLAVVLSIALQHGATIEELAKSITRDEDGNPCGIAGAILDAIPAEND